MGLMITVPVVEVAAMEGMTTAVMAIVIIANITANMMRVEDRRVRVEVLIVIQIIMGARPEMDVVVFVMVMGDQGILQLIPGG